MKAMARFLKPADNTRPYKSHRYDPFGLKIDRNVTLFCRAPLNAWVLLEANPDVLSYCERPLLVPDTKSKRVVDFWVGYRDGEELWILMRATEMDRNAEPQDVMPAFATWAATNKMPVRFIQPVDEVEQMTFLDNWAVSSASFRPTDVSFRRRYSNA